MEILKSYLESRFPTMNDIDRAHIESLLKDIDHKATTKAYGEGYERGRQIGCVQGAIQERVDAQAID